MYMVWVYDERKNLIDRYTSDSYSKAMTILIGNYGHNPRYEIRRVA